MYDNLEIFVLTYNRAKMLQETLETICKQTAQGFDIIVLDNASTDNTREVVEEIKNKYPQRNIKFISSEKNIGAPANGDRAMAMASKEWAMLFHDDDLMHPDYVKNAMELLEKNENAVMASCTYIPSENPNDENWENFSNEAYFADVEDFAALVLQGRINHSFSATIYKTSLLKTHAFNYELYGKIADRPFMYDVAKEGKTIILKAPYIRYRVHPGQDSNTLNTGPFIGQWFALTNCYKEILGNNWFNKYGIIYNISIHDFLKYGYNWMDSVNSKMSFKGFKKMAAENNLIRQIETNKIVEKVYKIIGSLFKRLRIHGKMAINRKGI